MNIYPGSGKKLAGNPAGTLSGNIAGDRTDPVTAARRPLIVVIVILAIIAAASPPVLADYRNSTEYKTWESSNFRAKKALEANQLVEAASLYQTALGQAKAISYGGPRAISSYGLARVYHKQGKYKKAEPLYKKALEIFESSTHRRIFHLYACIKDYADLLRKLGKTQEAAAQEARLKRKSP